MTPELYKQYRPTLFKEMIGQADACRVLSSLVKSNRIPHALLFIGPSGCGKTTLARIIVSKLECGAADFMEINCADFRGIEMVRDIRSRMMLAPMQGKARVWLIDEAHMLSKDAQNAFLKMLEDTPSHVYFLLATTDPDKLLTTIRTRCTEIKVKLLSVGMLQQLLDDVLAKEKVALTNPVMDKLIDHAEGSARKLLVLLNAVIGLTNEEDQLTAILASQVKVRAIELAQALLYHKGWSEVSAILRELDEDPESLRHMVLGYASAVLLKGGKANERAFMLLDVFGHSFFESKKPGLVTACYAVCTKGPK